MLIDLLPLHWKSHLKETTTQPYFENLSVAVEKAYQTTTCFPNKENIFKIFELVKLEEIKVVILGQDPYHGKGQAQGLSFSVPQGQKLPPSLRNIFEEMSSNTGRVMPFSGDLHHLTYQGVFLLNTILTVEEKKPSSHQSFGWQIFTDEVIKTISAKCEHVVFMLWGNYAQKKQNLIDPINHLILIAGHPSPMSANQGKWFGNNHFNLANDYLKNHQKEEINWLQDIF